MVLDVVFFRRGIRILFCFSDFVIFFGFLADVLCIVLLIFVVFALIMFIE